MGKFTTLHLNAPTEIFNSQLDLESGGVLQLEHPLHVSTDGEVRLPVTQNSATIRGPELTLSGDSRLLVAGNQLTVDGNLAASSLATIEVRQGSALQLDGDANIVGLLDLQGSSGQLIINGNTSIFNNPGLDLDGDGGREVVVNDGASLSVAADSVETFLGTLSINGGAVTGSPTQSNMRVEGDIAFDSSDNESRLNGNVVVAGQVNVIGGAVNTTVIEDATFDQSAGDNVRLGSAITTALGRLRLEGDTTIDAPLEISGTAVFPAGRHQVEVAGDLTLNSPLTITSDTLGQINATIESTSGGSQWDIHDDVTFNGDEFAVVASSGSPLELRLDSDARFSVISTANAWTLPGHATVRIVDAGNSGNHLTGSDVSIEGEIALGAEGKIASRLDVQETGRLTLGDFNMSLRGGSNGNPNQLLGGSITASTGLLQSTGSGLSGYGSIDATVDFGTSPLTAAGGTLTLDKEVASAGIVQVDAGAVLSLGVEQETSRFTELRLSGGSVSNAALVNDGQTRGFGMIKSASFRNEGSLVVRNGNLTIDSATTDLDGLLEIGTIFVDQGNLVVRNSLTDSFSGELQVNAGRIAEFSSPWVADGDLVLSGASGAPAQISGAELTMNGVLTVNQNGFLASPVVFAGSAEVQLPDANDRLSLVMGGTAGANTEWSGAGEVVLLDQATLAIASNADIDVRFVNQGTLRVDGEVGTLQIDEFEQSATGTIQLRLRDNGSGILAGDKLAITGSASFAGTLDLDSLNMAEEFELGDEYQIATYGSRSGMFDQVLLPELIDQLVWQQFVNEGEIRIRVAPGVSGDFDGDMDFSCADVDSLVAAIVAGSTDNAFDLDGNGVVDRDDLDQWLADAGRVEVDGPYLPGDANLDGVVDTSDFNAWNGNKFTNVASWCSGDFTADGVVDASDFNVWNSNKFTSSRDNVLVPEPSPLVLLFVGAICCMPIRRRRS